MSKIQVIIILQLLIWIKISFENESEDDAYTPNKILKFNLPITGSSQVISPSQGLRRKLSSSLSSITAPPSKSLRRESKPSQKLRDNMESLSQIDTTPVYQSQTYGKGPEKGKKPSNHQRHLRPRRIEY